MLGTRAIFCCDLGFESESFFFELYALDNGRLEHLVTGFHICQVQVGEHVRQHGQELITYRVPVE